MDTDGVIFSPMDVWLLPTMKNPLGDSASDHVGFNTTLYLALTDGEVMWNYFIIVTAELASYSYVIWNDEKKKKVLILKEFLAMKQNKLKTLNEKM